MSNDQRERCPPRLPDNEALVRELQLWRSRAEEHQAEAERLRQERDAARNSLELMLTAEEATRPRRSP